MRVQPAPSLEVVKLLFFAGGDVNLACSMGSSPLHQVACLGGGDPIIARRRVNEPDPDLRSRTRSTSSTQTLQPIEPLAPNPSILPPLYENSSADSTDSSTSVNHLSRQPSVVRPISPTSQTFPTWESTGSNASLSTEKAGLAGEETEAKLRELVRTFVWELGGDPDLKDSAGALPLHFAAQYGCSREIVRLLLEHDLETEEKFLVLQTTSPSSNSERIPARAQRNSSGLSAAEVSRPEFADLFAWAEEEGAQRRKTILASGKPVRTLEAGARWASETSSRISAASSLGSGGLSSNNNRQRESVLQPLPPLSNLEESKAMISQVVLNLGFVDETLSTGLISSIKDSLARQNSTHPGWPEKDLFTTPSDDGRSESIKRLRYSFQHGGGGGGSGRSSNASGNRFRAFSSSTGSSWWSEPRDVYSPSQVDRIRRDLDHSFHLFTHSAQMVARVLDFYSSALAGIEDTLRAYEEEVSTGLKSVSKIDGRIKDLRNREATLRSDLAQVQLVRERRTFDGKVESLIQEILNSFSSRVSNLQSKGLEGRALTMEISRATDEARGSFLSLKADLGDYHHPAESDLGPLCASIDEASNTVGAAKTRLLEEALAPPPPSSSSSTPTPVKHGSILPERRPPAAAAAPTPPALRQTRALSLSSGSLPPSPTSSSTQKFSHQQSASFGSLSAHSRGSSSDQTMRSSSTGAPREIRARSPPVWASWPRRKEDEAEYAAGLLNLQEVENDLRDVEERIEATHVHESELTQFMSTLQHTSTPTSSNSNSSSASASQRTEAFRLMSIVLQRRLSLQNHRTTLETEHRKVDTLLEKYDETEEGWDNTTLLASYLRGRLEEIYSPSYGKRIQAEVCWEEEGAVGVSFGAGAREEVELVEGGRGWLDLKEEEERVGRELEVLEGMLEGSEELCDRVEGDYGLILKESVAAVSLEGVKSRSRRVEFLVDLLSFRSPLASNF
ncbi:hypothetical protein BDY24DRAFT_385847 [Mrakia frigida]|uniref:uncharacterized protein n=1 Tax=Mrakia frigida TaxID=29902 RepID=UPI003FCC1126